MEPFGSHRGSQTAIFLAGCILSCLLQLVPAQENLTVVSVPEVGIQGQNIILIAKNIREGFEQCEWTQPSRNKISFVSDAKQRNDSQLVTVLRNCSLSIRNLRQSDQGKYTVKVTLPPAKQQEGKSPEIYIGSIFLDVCDGKQIRIDVQPADPRVGKNATLAPKGISFNQDNVFCHWKQELQSGAGKVFEEFKPGSNNQQQNQQERIRQHGCSLELSKLTLDDSGNYSVYVQVFSDQQSDRGKGNREQMRCYKSQTQLNVKKNGSASMKFSAGILAGALLGSLSWTSSLSLVPLLFGVLSPFFPEC